MATRLWWERPRLRTDEEEARERRVSWLELFYDLIFVVVIAEVAYYLAEHVSLAGVLGYTVLFAAVWWVWIGGTFYTERFEAGDLSYRIATFLLIIPVAAMAVYARDGLGETSAQFALSYAAARTAVTLLWVRAGIHARAFRPVALRYGLGFSASILLFISSIFVPPPLRFALWGIGLLLDFGTPITTLAIQARLPRFSTSKLPERFGLFVIIVLGEAIIGVVSGVAERESLSSELALTGMLGLALAFCLWWIYFDFIARRPPRRGVWWGLAWNYLHLPLVMSIAAIGAAVLNLLTLEQPNGVFWLLAGAVSVALWSMALLELTLRRQADEPTNPRVSAGLKLAGAVAALMLAAGGSALSPAMLLLALLPPLLIQMVYGAYVWYRPMPDAPDSARVVPDVASVSGET